MKALGKQLTKKEAILIAEKNAYWHLTKPELAKLQLSQEKLFCDFGVFAEAIEYTVKHPVFTHQFVTCYDILLEEVCAVCTVPQEDILESVLQALYRD